MASSKITELSSSIAANTAIYHEYLIVNGISLPSHDISKAPPGRPSVLPEDIALALDTAIEASHELHTLLINPIGSILNAAAEVSN
jgi:hypothetical protein